MKNKLIRDSVHGYIEIPSIIINRIIDTAIFQRLRRIEQTSMNALYPSAHHDRFMHSIGVYHLGKMAIRGLIENIKSEELYKKNELFWKRYSTSFELACLLHDCAHAPMSHSFEYAYLDLDDKDDCNIKKERLLNSMLCDIPEDNIESKYCKSDVEKYFENTREISPHEIVSAIVTGECFRDDIKSILREFYYDLTDDAISNCIVFIQRAIIGLKYTITSAEEYNEEICIKNCLIELLNGSFFDIDKLDYIVRDTVESGANNLSIDIPRILNALTLVEVNNFDKETDVNELELNNSIYFTGCKSSIDDKSKSSNCECSINLSGVRIKGKFQGLLEFLGERNYIKTPKSSGSRGKGKEAFDELTDIEASFEDCCKMTGQFVGQIETLNTIGSTIDGLVNAKVTGKIIGTIIGKINVSTKRRITYEIGYRKDALSVIEDTLIARNRLYLWIYAHNKVTYNDYILRQGILMSLLDKKHFEMGPIEQNKQSKLLLMKKMDIDNVFFENNNSENYLLDDGDLIHSMKVSMITNEKNIFAKRFFSRNHMFPVWKSYVEYNNFFSNLSVEQREKLWLSLFNDFTENSYKEANSDEYENSVLKSFSSDLEYVWIKPAGFKLKELDVSNIYIVLSDNSVKRLKDIMSQAKVSEQYVDESFFYLYTSKRLSPETKLKLVSFLKSNLKK